MIGFFRELKESLSALREAVSNLSVWKLGVNIKLEELQKEVRTLRQQIEDEQTLYENLVENRLNHYKLIEAFSEENYKRLAEWISLEDLAASLSKDNLVEISSSISLSTLCLDHILPKVVESALTNGTYNRLLNDASITAKKLVLEELTTNLLWDNKQEVFDAAAKELASDEFLCDHYPKLVKALAQELKKVFYLVPLAREVAKQPEVQQRAANYLANRIVNALSSDEQSKYH